ncbi:hypothetical protein CDCA_CDCA09G2574 [Cyanidium caldarium]|uniref:Importin N-terminal domain-containing protein n=1 Tax=Cyanidium caldarium TaxID=2771 RepID=A0AAV9IWA2_CYACA|nr:hypothetical protein CDCA_CDCA09G2574 [Cyanidium caldarium]
MIDLYPVVAATISPDASTRLAAEATLDERETEPGFVAEMVRVMRQGDEAPGALAVSQAAAVYVKNLVRRGWEEWPTEDRELLKASLLEMAAGTARVVRRQVVQALVAVAAHDFPERWPQLLAYVSQALWAGERSKPETPEWNEALGALEVLEALVERYRHEMRSDALFREILTVLHAVQEPLTVFFGRLVQQVKAGAGASVGAMLYAVVEVCYSLVFQDLPEYFEDHLGEWMGGLEALLQWREGAGMAVSAHNGVTNRAVDVDADALDDTEPSTTDRVQARALEVVNVFAEKYEEEFRPYLPAFLSVVWHLLLRCSDRARYDSVATAGIRFLTTVSSGVDHVLLENRVEGGDAGATVLQRICERVVVPNMQLRPCDEELFEDNPSEYVRWDLEGSDAGSRRRAAGELLKALLVHFELPVMQLFAKHVEHLLSLYAADPRRHWKDKDVAVYVVSALSWKSGTKAAGATATSSLIDIEEFFTAHIEPELRAAANTVQAPTHPILAADAVKFVMTFRSQLAVPLLTAAALLLIQLLQAPSTVIHTYAARGLERLLAPEMPTGTPRLSLDASSIATCGEQVLALLQRDQQNEQVMRLLLRLAPSLPLKAVPPTVSVLAQQVARVSDNSRNPLFRHALFETLAALLQRTEVAEVEAMLFAPFETILQQDLSELAPYVFQILAQMLWHRGGGATVAYLQLLPPLLAPPLWSRHGYIPSMVQLLISFLRVAPGILCDAEHLPRVLGVFQKLVSLRAHDQHGCQLLTAVMDACAGTERWQPYATSIVEVLMLRLQQARTPKYSRELVVCLSHWVVRLGAHSLMAAMEPLQPGLLTQVLEQVWVPELAMLTASVDTPVAWWRDAVAGKTVCAALVSLMEARPALWPQLLGIAVACCRAVRQAAGSGAAGVGAVTGSDGDQSEEPSAAVLEYSVEHAELRNVRVPAADPLPQVSDPVPLLLAALGRVCTTPAECEKLVAQGCTAEQARWFSEWLQARGEADR